MFGKGGVFEILRDESAPTADQALLAALPVADHETVEAIVETLLCRNERAGLLGLLERFHELDESIRNHILEHTDDLFGVLRLASQSRNEQVRLNMLDLIRRGCAYRAAYLVDSALHDRSASVRDLAAETLYDLADQILRTSPVADQDLERLTPETLQLQMADLETYAEDRRQVVGAIEGGLASFGVHNHPRVFEAAMWFVDDLGAKFWAVASVTGSRASQVALEVIQNAPTPRLVAFCINALNYGVFRSDVSRAMARCNDPAFLEEWVRQSWRLSQPKLAKGMLAVKALACLKSPTFDLVQLPAGARRHLARWISATGVPQESKLSLIRELGRQEDERTRRSATWNLTQSSDDRATSLLRRTAHGSDPASVRIARFELARRRPLEYPPADLIASPGTEQDPDAVWGEPCSLPTFDRYWSHFDRLSKRDQRVGWTELVDRSPDVPRELAGRLASHDVISRLRALRIIDVCELAEEFAEQICQLSRDDNPEVRSAAVVALGQLPSSVTRRYLASALSDENMRVQANAVEAVEKADDEYAAASLVPKLTSPDNRVRANAVKALLKLGVREAAETLLKMLQDPDRTQRISALWLVDHMGLCTLANRVIKMSEEETDRQVRERAMNLTNRLAGRQPAAVT